MLHTPDPDSTAPVDNTPRIDAADVRTREQYTAHDWEGLVERAAAIRDESIAAVELLSNAAIGAGCNPVRIRIAAGVL